MPFSCLLMAKRDKSKGNDDVTGVGRESLGINLDITACYLFSVLRLEHVIITSHMIISQKFDL